MIGQGSFQLQFCRSEFQGECWVNRFRLGCFLQLVEQVLRLLHIEHGDGRVTIGARIVGCEVDGRAAMRAIHRLNILSQLLDLFVRQWLDKFLFLEELEKGDEVAVVAAAPPIGEGHVSLHVVRKVEDRGAARTAERVRERRLLRR